MNRRTETPLPCPCGNGCKPGTRHKTRTPSIFYRLTVNNERRYIVVYRDSHGVKRFETMAAGSTEKDAIARKAELVNRLAKGEKVIVSNRTVADLCDVWLESRQHLRPNTVLYNRYAVENWIKPQLGHLRASKVDVLDVVRLIRTMQKDNKKAWTIRGVLGPLNLIFQDAVRAGYVPSNPMLLLKSSERPRSDQRRMRILSSEEIQLVLKNSPDRYRGLLSFLVFTGLRIGEVLALRWTDVDLDSGLVKVRESKTEAGAGREVILMPALVTLLRKHKLASDFSQPHHLVFSNEAGGMLDRRNVLRRGLHKAIGATESAVPRVTLHELRHTYASILLSQGHDFPFVAEQMGHTNPATTMRLYGHLVNREQKRDSARAALEAEFGGML